MINLINVEEPLRNALEIIGWYCKHNECKTCGLKINDNTCITDKDPDVWWMYLNADRKTEPTISKMEQVEDEPQTDYERGYQDGIKDEIDKHHIGR